ncbi:MAG: hypothetical protein K6L73_13115 [Cellvibrionaceae bacterium]
MSYFALNGIQDEIQAQSADMVNYRLPSYGIFSTSLTPQYWFGVPRNTSFSGLSMDVDLVKMHRAAKDNNHEKTINYTKAIGSRYSAMEYLVPELIFSIDTAPVQGISAVKALAIAAAEGQRIYTITQDNLNEALNEINLDADTETEIRNAVNAGKTATAHEAQIIFNNWVGSGYILLDESTGAGAYKIAGGSNGGVLIVVTFALIAAALFLALATTGFGFLMAGFIALAYKEFASNVSKAAKTAKTDEELDRLINEAAFIAIMKTLLALLGPAAKALGADFMAIKLLLSGALTICSLSTFCTMIFVC